MHISFAAAAAAYMRLFVFFFLFLPALDLFLKSCMHSYRVKDFCIVNLIVYVEIRLKRYF